MKAIDGDVAAGTTVGASPALHRVQQQTERVSDWYTLDSPLKRCLGIAERPDKHTDDALYEELRVAGESDEKKALHVHKDREERHEYMKQQLQQQQQNWKGVFGSRAVSVSTSASNNRKSPPSYSNNITGMVDDNNTVVSNITNANDDNN